MCTALHLCDGCHLFGRTLDFAHSFGEQGVITPRGYNLPFADPIAYSIIGIGRVEDKTPLYFDAMNECGLAIAALHFPRSAVYRPPVEGMYNLPSYALMGWVLGHCATLTEAVAALGRVNVTGESISRDLPATPLHWMLADRSGAAVIESVASGLRIYENPYGVLTNEPTFPHQLTRLCDYAHLCASMPVNRLAPHLPLVPCSGGTSALGLPGDFSSPSRFVRAFYAKEQSRADAGAEEQVRRFFHVMHTVQVPRGCAVSPEGEARTLYTSCADTDSLTYYVTTYGSGRLRSFSLGTYGGAEDLTVFSFDETEIPSPLSPSP